MALASPPFLLSEREEAVLLNKSQYQIFQFNIRIKPNIAQAALYVSKSLRPLAEEI
jgi:hypothetical protein